MPFFYEKNRLKSLRFIKNLFKKILLALILQVDSRTHSISGQIEFLIYHVPNSCIFFVTHLVDKNLFFSRKWIWTILTTSTETYSSLREQLPPLTMKLKKNNIITINIFLKIFFLRKITIFLWLKDQILLQYIIAIALQQFTTLYTYGLKLSLLTGL